MKAFFQELAKRKGAELYIALVGGAIVVALTFMAVAADMIAPYDPIARVGDPLQPPSPAFLMGTDLLGRDLFSRIVYGSKTALAVALLSVLISLACGAPLGLVSGYVGGKTDRAASLVMDSIYSFPSLILAIAVAAVLGPGIANAAITIAVVYIPTYFRMVRSHVLSLKAQPFVEAARALGARDRTIMTRYIFPNVVPSVVVVISLNAVDAILTLAALNFFGLGIPAPTPDWGLDLYSGRGFLVPGYWWLITFPGLMIMIAALGFSLLGEGLDELLNPRLREE